MSDFVTRFAPSPSGLLHLGHAFSALFAFSASQNAGGRFILRIEDIDTTRCRAEFEHTMMDDLRWLGLKWEAPVRRQSEHFDDYAHMLERLRALGVVYRCFHTRRALIDEMARAPHGQTEVYTGPATPMNTDEQALRIAKGEAFAWRLSLRAAREMLGQDWETLCFTEQGQGPKGEHGTIRARPEKLGDVVLARKDIGTSYHLAVTHDDAAQGITHVLRGQDLFESTHIHVLLQALLGLPTPVYRHHGLIRDATGQRLATRNHAASLQSLRAAGKTPKEVLAMVKLK
ncbi:MAG: tRNA glutamyl-Q(34) synthetase GluQRS [Robiginitomaculum sp.]|nr:MAG: tRNA glutamyl-Q(34) synthetase GluQRS [Robiginitomaculum sp.]